MPLLKTIIVVLDIYFTIEMFIAYILVDLFYSYANDLIDEEDDPFKDDVYFLTMAKRFASSEKSRMAAFRFLVLNWPIVWIGSGILDFPTCLCISS